jgi:hypothetical protein
MANARSKTWDFGKKAARYMTGIKMYVLLLSCDQGVALSGDKDKAPSDSERTAFLIM